MDERVKRRQELYELLKVANARVFDARQKLHRLENDHYKLRQEYEALDRELALECKTVITSSKKEKKEPKLTVDQLKMIAAKLGIEINEGGN